jgi:hypothetical protein
MANVFLGVPLYNRNIDFAASAWAFTPLASQRHGVSATPLSTSLIPATCNHLWCEALNNRDKSQWFAILHGDVEPDDFWLDTLIEQAEQQDADFVSAVIPIKERKPPLAGCTSTAISLPNDRFSRFCRLTQAQVCHPSFPTTFGVREAADALERLPADLRIENVPREFLLANTGCMVCRLDRPWCEAAYFDNPNAIASVDGKFTARNLPEDWFFSRRIAELGGKVMATKSVRVKHWGLADFDSHEVWGVKRDL